MRRALLTVLVVLAAAAGACGGDEPVDTTSTTGLSGALGPVEDALRTIDSGRIAVAIRAHTPETEAQEFEMSGVFAAAADDGSIPVADLAYVDRSGEHVQHTAFVADGTNAWVVNAKGAQKVTDSALESLAGGDDPAGIRGLSPSTWFSGEVQERPGESADGMATTIYTGEADAALFLDDFLPMAANLGAYVAREIKPADMDRVRAAAQGATLEVVATDAANLLTRVTFRMDMATDPDELRDVLRELSARRIELDLSLSEINRPVQPPSAPEGAAV